MDFVPRVVRNSPAMRLANDVAGDFESGYLSKRCKIKKALDL